MVLETKLSTSPPDQALVDAAESSFVRAPPETLVPVREFRCWDHQLKGERVHVFVDLSSQLCSHVALGLG